MGRNLVSDFDGKTAVKWDLSVSQHLFTKNEIRLGTLLPNTRTNRAALFIENNKIHVYFHF